jgi:Putative peptidoglycan binding domain
LDRLLGIHHLLFGKPDPAALVDLTGEVAAEVAGRLTVAGYPAAGDDPEALDRALASWAGVENLEERLVPRRIDPLVLAHLRQDRA